MEDIKWWQKSVFYQIYPRSFADGNGDGIGDFPGMISKLDYLQALGVDALWLSPHFPSPMADCGYDISDYEQVAPEYGTMDDFKRFLDGVHQRDMHVILDLVLNHTSDHHRWFLESLTSRNNPKSDWYVWMDAPPNNWQSCFDGPAWTYAPERDQYYYHYFMRQQPDLNWHNPEVRQAMWRSARFWLDMGVDGYRLDAIGTIFEDPDLTSHSVPMNLAELRHFSDIAATPEDISLVQQYWRDMFKYQLGQPGLHDLMKELRLVLNEYEGDRMLVGEDDDLAYLGDGSNELDMVFNFPLMRTSRLTPAWIRTNQQERLAQLEAISPAAWACNTLGNHDSPRVYSQFSASRIGGDPDHDADFARLNTAVLLALRGTPFLYYGEEIGMQDTLITDPAMLRDTMATWYFDRLVHELNVEADKAAVLAGRMSRDKNRTPMQWNREANAGFCPGGKVPWLPVNPNYLQGFNVHDQENDPASLLNFYGRLLKARKASTALLAGDYRPIAAQEEEFLAFIRSSPSQKVLVVLNFSDDPQAYDFRDEFSSATRVLFSSIQDRQLFPLAGALDPFAIWIVEIE